MVSNVNAVGFVLSLKCNAKCRHCAPRAGPDHQQQIASDDLCKWLDEAHSVGGMRVVVFSGGEPFLYPDLVKVITKSGKLFPNVHVLTNAFWATDPKTAKDVLSPLAAGGLTMLGISADDFHQEFVPIDRVRNAIAACRYYDLACTIQSVGHSKDSIKPDELKCFRGKSELITRDTLPLGRALDEKLPVKPAKPVHILESSICSRAMEKEKNRPVPTVVPNGNVYGCDLASFRS